MGFLKPFNLLYLLSVGALVLIYLRARSRPTVDVSSLMLFEERAAPVAKSRVLRVDLPFWLEMLALSALSLTLAGLYLKTMVPAVHHRLHALIFDLGAGMGARGGWGTRLDQARSKALGIVDSAEAGDEFTVIGYALEARVRQAQSARLPAVRDSIRKLRAMAVAARPAALRAALMNARDAAQVDLFTDHAPAPGLVEGVKLAGRIAVHMVGAPADNLAIVSLEPGILRSGKGHCVLRNFSPNARRCGLEIDVGGKPVFHSNLVLDPNAEAAVPFGPLTAGGVVHARIVTSDALAADNDRYAYEPPGTPDRVLVMSPDPQVRDDLARVLLAINENFIVTAADPAKLHSSNLAREMAKPFKLAVMHDSYDAAIRADAQLVIFPEPWLKSPGPSPGLAVVGSVAFSEMQDGVGLGTLKDPLLLGPARVLELPGWMEALAHGTAAGGHEPFPIAAAGYSRQGRLAVIAFDIRNHLLLNPDKLDALLLTIGTVKRLIAPEDLKIVSTGGSVSVPASGPVRIVAPDGIADSVKPGRWGIVRFRPLEAGRYRIERPGAHAVEVLANYYDAGESDLAAKPPPDRLRGVGGAQTAAAGVPVRVAVHPLGLLLITLALVFVIGESAILARRAIRWGARRV